MQFLLTSTNDLSWNLAIRTDFEAQEQPFLSKKPDRISFEKRPDQSKSNQIH